MKESTFWSNFEEPVGLLSAECDRLLTQTRTREEPDQRNTAFTSGFGTRTATREAPDQAESNMPYSAFIESSSAMRTKTFTEAREEPDQDESARIHASIPNQPSIR